MIRINTEMINSREVDFADCYKRECPYYSPAGTLEDYEFCRKVESEYEPIPKFNTINPKNEKK